MVCLSMQKHVVFKAKFWYSEQNTKKKILRARSGVSAQLLNFLKNISPQNLSQQKQRALVNVQCSSWKNLLSGGPQGTNLGPQQFYFYE